jgi:GDSL-like Lipase/Acylhydrolase./Bacterial Ig-like domain (group 1)./Bacterial Ig-like domain (group 2).
VNRLRLPSQLPLLRLHRLRRFSSLRGGVETVTETPKGASGKPLTGRPEVWTSSDPSVATVAAGLVTGVAKGVATISVTVETVTATVNVEVRDGEVIGPAGGSVSVLAGSVTVAVPAGAVSSARSFSVKPAANPPAARRLMPGTAYEFGPTGAQFSTPVTVSIKYDPAGLLPDSPESGLQLYEAVNGSWQVVPGSTVDLATKTVSGAVSHFSSYGILMQPIVDTVRVTAPPQALVVKTSFQFVAVIKDSAGATLTRPTTWTSSAPSIIQIDPATGAASALIPGTATITATSEKKSGSLAVTVVAGPAAHLLRVTPESVTGAAGVALAAPPAVQVTDAFGNGVSGFTVTFAVASGGGSLSGAVATTNANGFTSPVSWTLGTAVGSNTVTATAAGLPESPMTFTANASAGPPATISANSVTTLTGTAGGLAPVAPSVKVVDAFGNPTPSVTVTFTPANGSGTASGSGVTNSAGIATLDSWKFGTTAGTQTLQATITGVSGSPVTFTATTVPPVPSSMVVFAGAGQSAVILANVPVSPAVRITDPAGVPVPGMAVTFAVTAGGGSLTGANAVTDDNGVATAGTWTMGLTAGDNTVTASAGSLPSVAITATAVQPVPVAMSLVQGQNQTAAAGSNVVVNPAVKITDSQGRGVPNITVTFTVTGGGGTITNASVVTNASGVATVGSWTLGVGANTLLASTPQTLAGNPVRFNATGVPFLQVVTFGDSNTDRGYSGSNPTIVAASYVSNDPQRLGAADPNNSTQLAGKIEARWKAARSQTIRVVNHGITSTRTGTGRTGLGSPNALEPVNGVTRFEGEVLGLAFPWNGGEPQNQAFAGPILRVNAFKARPQDFVYVSMGTNDLANNVNTDDIGANLSKLVDLWVGAGLPASHFIITTLPPRDPGQGSLYVPGMNFVIRRLAGQRGLTLIDLSPFVSNDDGNTWKDPSLNVGDSIHYSEVVRNWLADQVFAIINANTP